MQTMMTMMCPQPAHGDNDMVMQPLHSKTMCPQPVWEMMGMRPKRAPVLPMVWMRTRPYNPCAAMMTTWPESIQVANNNNVATARMSDNDALRAPAQLTGPMQPHNLCCDKDDVHTACASNNNNAPEHPMAPTWPHNSCATETTHLSPVRDDQHCSLNIIL